MGLGELHVPLEAPATKRFCFVESVSYLCIFARTALVPKLPFGNDLPKLCFARCNENGVSSKRFPNGVWGTKSTLFGYRRRGRVSRGSSNGSTFTSLLLRSRHSNSSSSGAPPGTPVTITWIWPLSSRWV